MVDNTKNKAVISEETIKKLSYYVLGGIPAMAKVDMAAEEMKNYDKIGKYVLGAIPLMANPNETADMDK